MNSSRNHKYRRSQTCGTSAPDTKTCWQKLFQIQKEEEGVISLSTNFNRFVQGVEIVNKILRTEERCRWLTPKGRTILPTKVVGSTIVPVVFTPEDKLRMKEVKVVEDLPYGCILGASFFHGSQQ